MTAHTAIPPQEWIRAQLIDSIRSARETIERVAWKKSPTLSAIREELSGLEIDLGNRKVSKHDLMLRIQAIGDAMLLLSCAIVGELNDKWRSVAGYASQIQDRVKLRRETE